jgi:hypothetical protein
MTLNRLFLRGIVVSFFLCLTGSLADAVPRTWVAGSSTGNVAPCSRTAPCMTFAFAIGQTDPGGEIDVLDSGDFGPVIIAHSVSIVADGVLGGIQVSSGDAIDVNAGSTDVIVLRGLTIDGLSGATGIELSAGGVLHIEGCTINGFPASVGIRIIPASGQSRVFIKDTIVRGGDTGILFAPFGSGKVTASLDNVRIENNFFGVFVDPSATVSVRNSVAAGNGSGFEVRSFFSFGTAVMNLESSMVSGNAVGVVTDGAFATANISNVTVVDNTTGLSATSGGHIVSFGNNKVTNNTTNGTPTQTISQK